MLVAPYDACIQELKHAHTDKDMVGMMAHRHKQETIHVYGGTSLFE